MENTSHQGNEEGSSFQNPSDDENESINPKANMVLEQPNQKFLELKHIILKNKEVFGTCFQITIFSF